MKGWKLYGKVAKTQQKAVLKQLKEQGYSTTTDYFTGVIYYRKNRAVKRVRLQDFATQDYLKTKKREKFLDRFKKLVVIWSICLLLLAGLGSWKDSPQAKTMSLANKEFVLEPNLSPVRFTPDELKMIEEKRQAYKKQYIKATLIANYSGDVERKIAQYFGEDADWAIRCFRSESGLRPTAIGTNRNGTKDVGIAQINTPTHCSKLGESNWNRCIESLQDIDTNLKVAKAIYDRQGSKPWYGRSCN